MREWMRKLEMERPTFEMLKFNNIYTESRKDFRWRFAPDIENGKILASKYTTLCYECANDVEEKEFDLTEEGFIEAKAFIQEKFDEFVKNNQTRY